MNPGVRLRSTWCVKPIGKLLTDARIVHYMREGRYGAEAKRKVLLDDAIRKMSKRIKALRAREYV